MNRPARRWLACALTFLLAVGLLPHGTARAAPELVPVVSTVPDYALQELLQNEVDDEPCVYGIAVKHLTTGYSASVNGDRVIEAASLYKLAVMYEFYRQQAKGDISLSDVLIGSTIIDFDEHGQPVYGGEITYTVAEALHDMIAVSDNEASLMLLFRLGQERINTTMAWLGLAHTRVDYDTSTTPNEMLRLLELIATGSAVNRQASWNMLQLLLDQQINDRLPEGLPPGTPVAHKTGNLPSNYHDAGIVYAPSGPFVIVIMTGEAADEEATYASIRRISRAVYDYFETSRNQWLADRAALFS